MRHCRVALAADTFSARLAEQRSTDCDGVANSACEPKRENTVAATPPGMLFPPGSRAGNSSIRTRSVVAWRLHLLITVVVETSLPKAQPISGVVVDSSVSPSQSDGRGDSNATEPVPRSTATVVGVDVFHLEHEASPNAPDIFPRETKPQAFWQEVEVSGTHLVREPAARRLKGKGGHKMPSDTPSMQNQFWIIFPRRILEATYCFAAVALFGLMCLMYPQIQSGTDSSRRTSSPDRKSVV